MRKHKLKSGAMFIHYPSKSPSVVIEVMVKVGSNDEHDGIRGISHFLEHMLFEGTERRPDSQAIASEIEKLGGEMNAYTTTDRTAYFIKVLGKHADTAIDVLSDMLLHSTFPEKFVEKEKKVILKEIHMVLDDPRFYKWVLFGRTLYRKHPARHPTYGTTKDVAAMTRDKLIGFYGKHYAPQNLIITVAGNLKDAKRKIQKAFDTKRRKPAVPRRYAESKQRGIHSAHETRKTNSAYTVLGFRTCPRSHKDSYALDILEAILGRGQSGRMFEEIRNRHGLAYEVGVDTELATDTGHFAVHASTDPSKTGITKKLMLEQFRRPATPQEVREAKTFLEGSITLEMEDNRDRADALCTWERMVSAEKAQEYLKRIKKITRDEVLRVQRKYFGGHYAVAVIGPKKSNKKHKGRKG